jgi:hypothetical protein
MNRKLSILALTMVCLLCMAPLLPDVTTVTTAFSRLLLRSQNAAQSRETTGCTSAEDVTNIVYALLVSYGLVVVDTPDVRWDMTTITFDSTTNTWDAY